MLRSSWVEVLALPSGPRPGAPRETFDCDAIPFGDGSMLIVWDGMPYRWDGGPLVALGEPMEHVGAGRIRIGEDQWRDAVKLLSDHAALIILLPSSRPGTLWEVERLLESGLIARTIIVDPPNAAGGKNHYDQGSEWAQVRAAFAQRGYVMPKDSRVGQLLYFGRERAPKASAGTWRGRARPWTT